MSTKTLTIFILAHVCLLMAKTPTAQFIIDTNGEPVESDEEYFIRPVISENGGRFTLFPRNATCPLNVGLDSPGLPHGLTVIFTPFAPHHDEDDVRVNRDLKVTFIATTACSGTTDWRLGDRDESIGRRFIITGRDDGTVGSYGNFFRIVETQNSGIYNIIWCPTEVCPSCRFECGTVGILNENGKVLLALDSGALPVVFQKD